MGVLEQGSHQQQAGICGTAWHRAHWCQSANNGTALRGEHSPAGWAAPGFNTTSGFGASSPVRNHCLLRFQCTICSPIPLFSQTTSIFECPALFSYHFPFIPKVVISAETKMVGFPPGHLFLVLAAPPSSHHQFYTILFPNPAISHSK